MLSAFARLAARLLALVRPGRLDRDLDQEVEFHLAMLVDDHRRLGLTQQESERAARLALGARTQLREAHRDERGLRVAEEIVQDVRYGMRLLRRNPGFSAAAVLTLAIGIGANTAMFSVIHGVLLQPLPYPDPAGLLIVARGIPEEPGWLSLPRIDATRAATESFAALGAYLARRNEDVIISGGTGAEVLKGSRVSANFLEVLGVKPQLGRSFRPEEDVPGGAPVAMISDGLWRRRFAASESIQGNTVTLDSTPYTIVGVLPPEFRFPFPAIDVWFTQPSQTPSLPAQYRNCCVQLFGFARLKPGVSMEQARAELDVVSARYAAEYRLDSGPLRITPLKEELTANVDTLLWMLVAVVGFVLLIACANVATLLMARATTRARELAVRTAVGAPRVRLFRQLLTESALLGAGGGGLGLLLAWMALTVVTRMTVFDLPRADEIQMSGAVLAFTVTLSSATAMLFGMGPALRVMRPGVVDPLRQHGATDPAGAPGRRGSRVDARAALVIAQVALSMVLVVGAALMLRTVAAVANVDAGFRSTGLLTMRVPLAASRYDTPERRAAFFDELTGRVEAVPTVDGVAVARSMPTTGTFATNLQIEGQEIPEPGHVGMVMQTITPGYFRVLDVPVRSGREFTPRDNAVGAPPVVIVNESFARRFWPGYPQGSEPLGRRIWIPILGDARNEIVGVVADVRHGGLTREAPPQFYIPNALYPPQTAEMAIRTDGDPTPTIAAVRAAVQSIDPDQSVADIRTMDEILEQSVGRRHLVTRLLGLFAATAMLLALVGIYGIVAYSVAHRTHEIGIRRSLGAHRRSILALVLRQGLQLTLIGVACGLAGAFAFTRVLDTLLFEVTATDPATFAGAAVTFVVVSLAASLLPAWRAIRIDPGVVLRT
jgi:putative ABC transport system permease protein